MRNALSTYGVVYTDTSTVCLSSTLPIPQQYCEPNRREIRCFFFVIQWLSDRTTITGRGERGDRPSGVVF